MLQIWSIQEGICLSLTYFTKTNLCGYIYSLINNVTNNPWESVVIISLLASFTIVSITEKRFILNHRRPNSAYKMIVRAAVDSRGQLK